jgi:hypothetical protein
MACCVLLLLMSSQFLELVDTHDNIRSIDMGENDPVLTIPLSFHVPPPDRIGASNQIPCYPPSLEVGKRYLSGVSSNIRAHGFVRYHIEARLYEGDRVVIARIADIKVLNTITETPPPIPLDDFPDDYTCTTSKPIGSGKIKTWWSNRCNVPNPRMRLSVTIPEPAVLRLGHALRRDDSTADAIDLIATINLKTFSFTADEIKVPPEELHVTMSWLLSTTTSVSVVPMENMPTLTETASDPYTARSSSSTPLRTAKMVLHDWAPATTNDTNPISILRQQQQHQQQQQQGEQPLTEPPTPPNGYEARWQTSQTLHLTLPGLPEGSTTFSTPYISRRHCLLLQLECRSQGSAAVQLKLRIPVQIALTRTARITYQGGGAAATPHPSPSSSPSGPLDILRGDEGCVGEEVVASPVYSR